MSNLREQLVDFPIRTVNIGDFNPNEDQVRDDDHLLLYITEVEGPDGKTHFKFGTTERTNRSGEVRGNFARELFQDRLNGYSTELLPKRTLSGLFILPRHYKGVRWTDTRIGNKIFKGLLGLQESNRFPHATEIVTNTSIEELKDTLTEQFGGSKKKSIYNDGGFHDYQKEVINNIYEAVRKRVENGNTESLDILEYLAARFGKNRTFLKTIKDLWQDFGYGAFIISPYWLSVHNGFEQLIREYREFDDFVFIDARPDGDEKWEDRLEWAYKNDDVFPVVAVSLVKGEDSKSDIQKITYVPKDERITLIDEADYGAHTENSEELIDYIEGTEHAYSWGPKPGDSVPLNMKTTGSGQEKMAKYDIEWDKVKSIPYLELVRQKNNGNQSLQHVVEPVLRSWNAEDTLADELKRRFSQEQIPSLYQLAQKADQNEHIWRKIFQVVFSDYPDGKYGPASGMNVVNEAANSISNFDKAKDGLGVMAKMPSVSKESLLAIEKAAEEALDDWAVMTLCGRVYGENSNVVYEGTTNVEAEDKVKGFLKEKYDPKKHKRGVLILTMGMGFRSFTVPDISVVANFSDGGEASTIVQAASRAFSPRYIKYLSEGDEKQLKEKNEAMFADYGFDQSKTQDAITKFLAQNLFAERDSDRSDDESIGETWRRIYPSVDVMKYMGENRRFGDLEPSDLLNEITDTNKFSERGAFNTNTNPAYRFDSIRKIFGKAKSLDISKHFNGNINIDAGSSSESDQNTENPSDDEANLDSEKLAEKSALLRGMGFTLPIFAGDENSIFDAIDKIQEKEELREDWISLCGITPEEYRELLVPTENGNTVMPVDEISLVFHTRDDTPKKALNGVLKANRLFEVPGEMVEKMMIYEDISPTDNIAIVDAAGPKLIKKLPGYCSDENVMVFTRYHLVKRHIKKEFPNISVKVVDVKDGESIEDAYKRKMREADMNFDSAIGNPPYHEDDDGHGASSTTVYDDFVKLSQRLAEKTCLVVPARWFIGGKGLSDFRNWMLQREDIESIQYWNKEDNPFKNTRISGGVCVIYTSKNKDSDKVLLNGTEIKLDRYDIIVSDTESYPIIDSVRENSDRFLNEIYVPSSFSGISPSDDELCDSKKTARHIPCYTFQQGGFKRWVDFKETKNMRRGGDQIHVLTAEANGDETDGFGNTFVAKRNETFSKTYIGFEVSSFRKAVSLRTYLNTKFANHMLRLRKISQHISGKTTEWVPLPPLDRIWTDEELQKESYFGLTSNQWDYILKSSA